MLCNANFKLILFYKLTTRIFINSCSVGSIGDFLIQFNRLEIDLFEMDTIANVHIYLCTEVATMPNFSLTHKS